jgi:hypothetical protein
LADEPAPKDISHPELSLPNGGPILGEEMSMTDLLNTIRMELRELSPKDAIQERILRDCAAEYSSFLRSRWDIIEESTNPISPPFYGVLSVWLMILFASFGLIAKPSLLSGAIVTLSALSIALVVGLITDLDRPYGGLFTIPSTATRDAFAHIVRD